MPKDQEEKDAKNDYWGITQRNKEEIGIVQDFWLLASINQKGEAALVILELWAKLGAGAHKHY